MHDSEGERTFVCISFALLVAERSHEPVPARAANSVEEVHRFGVVEVGGLDGAAGPL